MMMMYDENVSHMAGLGHVYDGSLDLIHLSMLSSFYHEKYKQKGLWLYEKIGLRICLLKFIHKSRWHDT